MADKPEGLKSAFDLAMERLAAREGESKPLSDAQKEALAEVDREAKARTAETEIMYTQKIAAARAAGDAEKTAETEAEKRRELERIQERAERRKNEIREGHG